MDILCNNINCNGIGMRRADWDNFRECKDIVLNGQVIWVPIVLSSAVKSQIYEDIVTTGHHSASLAAEVWRAANLYCKSHAATHPDLTAQGKLLSAFVNADKDMYCSLPLALTPEAQSALPTRWLVGDGSAYIITNLYPTNNTNIEAEFKFTNTTNATCAIFGGNSNDDNKNSAFQWNSRFYYVVAMGIQVQIGSIYKMFDNNGNFELLQNGVSVKTSTISKGTYTSNTPIYLFSIGARNLVTYISNHKISYFKTTNSDSNFIPCHTTANGMLDLETLTFYGNAAATGSFTIEKS